jgi:hypothetical protein
MGKFRNLEEIEEWIRQNFDVSDFGVESECGEITIWLKDTYFDYRDLQKLREKFIITEWHVEALDCEVLLEVRGYEFGDEP